MKKFVYAQNAVVRCPLTSASVDDFDANFLCKMNIFLYQIDAGRQAVQMGIGRLGEVIYKEVLTSSTGPSGKLVAHL